MFLIIIIKNNINNSTKATNFLKQLGRKLTTVSEDPSETAYLFQRVSVSGAAKFQCGLHPQHF